MSPQPHRPHPHPHHSHSSHHSVPNLLAPIPEDNAPAQNELYESREEDLVLVSSDGQIFRTHSSRLRTVSPVFETMHELSPTAASHTLHFVDPRLESATTISLFLNLISSRPLPTPDTQTFAYYETLITFLQKYECRAEVLEALGKKMREWLEDGRVSASKAFRAGCRVGDDALCREAVGASNEWTWTGTTRKGLPKEPPTPAPTPPTTAKPSTSTSRSHKSRAKSPMTPPPSPPSPPSIPASPPPFDIREDGIFGSPALDLSAMPFEFFRSLPDEHKFALLRATRNVGMGSGVKLDGCDWEKVATEFEKVLKEVTGKA
ncbi:hypothetical protein IAT38_000598 [Cryptococcus sp. DSM 104549]